MTTAIQTVRTVAKELYPRVKWNIHADAWPGTARGIYVRAEIPGMRLADGLPPADFIAMDEDKLRQLFSVVIGESSCGFLVDVIGDATGTHGKLDVELLHPMELRATLRRLIACILKQVENDLMLPAGDES